MPALATHLIREVFTRARLMLAASYLEVALTNMSNKVINYAAVLIAYLVATAGLYYIWKMWTLVYIALLVLLFGGWGLTMPGSDHPIARCLMGTIIAASITSVVLAAVS